jgi:Uma2 family endonuclease
MGRRESFGVLEPAPDAGRPSHLHDGELPLAPYPVPRHQLVAQNLGRVFHDYAAEHGGLAIISSNDIVFSEDDVARPDLVFFTPARRHLVQIDATIRHPPDLVVEVISPSTASADRAAKMEMLARYGVSEYWIVYPIVEAIEIYMLAASAYQRVLTFTGASEVRSLLLSGLAFSASRIFPA